MHHHQAKPFAYKVVPTTCRRISRGCSLTFIGKEIKHTTDLNTMPPIIGLAFLSPSSAYRVEACAVESSPAKREQCLRTYGTLVGLPCGQVLTWAVMNTNPICRVMTTSPCWSVPSPDELLPLPSDDAYSVSSCHRTESWRVAWAFFTCPCQSSFMLLVKVCVVPYNL